MKNTTGNWMRYLKAVFAAGHEEERGDVPGWVMITLMTAVLVAAILALALPALTDLFNSAIEQVSR
ncbi:hypothetical protein [Micrococcoides hystricis]|uniref:Pilus assembly protein n=1 Tax=Micrococcoides hystricis TaxID=1572761 RepID=A0ABV6P8I3_9MICC